MATQRLCPDNDNDVNGEEKTIFSAHLVTTPRLCRENLELLLSVRLLSSLQIKGDGNDSDVGDVGNVDEDVSLGALALICCEPNLSVQGSWMATTFDIV